VASQLSEAIACPGCTALLCPILYCTVLYCLAKHSTVLYCPVKYSTVLYFAVLSCPVLRCTVCTVLCHAVLHALHSNALYCTVEGGCPQSTEAWEGAPYRRLRWSSRGSCWTHPKCSLVRGDICLQHRAPSSGEGRGYPRKMRGERGPSRRLRRSSRGSRCIGRCGGRRTGCCLS